MTNRCYLGFPSKKLLPNLAPFPVALGIRFSIFIRYSFYYCISCVLYYILIRRDVICFLFCLQCITTIPRARNASVVVYSYWHRPLSVCLLLLVHFCLEQPGRKCCPLGFPLLPFYMLLSAFPVWCLGHDVTWIQFDGSWLFGPRQANLVLIAYASSEGSGEPAHPRSLARTFAARSYKQWVKRNLQTESQIPGPSEWLGMRS